MLFEGYLEPEAKIYEVRSEVGEKPIRIREWIVLRRIETFSVGVHNITYDCINIENTIQNDVITTHTQCCEISHIELVCDDRYFRSLKEAVEAYRDSEYI